MPTIFVLPHKNFCPNGATLEAFPGETILDVLLRNNIEVEHACEKSCICTTCHCIVRKGFESLSARTEDEDDILDKAWGLEVNSRLSCQAIINNTDLIIEFPRYTINYTHEY